MKLERHLIGRQAVKLAKHDRLEHHHRIPRLAARLRLPLLWRLAPERLQPGPENFPGNHSVDLRQGIDLGIQTRVPLPNVEEAYLTHRRPSYESTTLPPVPGIFRGALKMARSAKDGRKGFAATSG